MGTHDGRIAAGARHFGVFLSLGCRLAWQDDGHYGGSAPARPRSPMSAGRHGHRSSQDRDGPVEFGRHMMRKGLSRLALAGVAAAFAQNVSAADAQHRIGRHGQDFHRRDFRQFSPTERAVWRSDHREKGLPGDQSSASWMTAGGWYYPEPIYPYPTYVPPPIVVQPPALPGGPPPAQSWYYCDNPRGYYPYVPACNGPWREVPATSQK
jgi:hypothetical protein